MTKKKDKYTSQILLKSPSLSHKYPQVGRHLRKKKKKTLGIVIVFEILGVSVCVRFGEEHRDCLVG